MSAPLLALKLKELRIQHSYTQKYISYYLNISRGGYAQYETGSRMPSNDILLRLAELYHVGIDVFINADTIPLSKTNALPPETVSEQNAETTETEEITKVTETNQITKNNQTIETSKTEEILDSLSPKQLQKLGLFFLNSSPSLLPEQLSQEDINFLSLFKSLPVETQEDIKLFCSCKSKQLSKKASEIASEK